MARRKKRQPDDAIEPLLKAGFFFLVAIALGVGGFANFTTVLVRMVLGLALVAIIVAGAIWFLRRRSREHEIYDQARRPASPRSVGITEPVQPVASDGASTPGREWDALRIRRRLNEIDWYQFEKFCAALLRADGFAVERRGGAHPDGGVDLIVEKNQVSALIQCKHWRTWEVKEKTVREMLGSMVHFGVKDGAIYTLKGWTKPAAMLAEQHAITLVNGDELAASAELQLSDDELDRLLDTSVHHCPKCEARMVWREGDFEPFWGCSTYPRCHGKLNRTGAK